MDKLKVVETFAGIGAQRQALENIGRPFEILATCEWDISTIIGYHMMHENIKIPVDISSLSKAEVVKKLSNYTLSNNGKKEVTSRSFGTYNINSLQFLLTILENKEKRHFTDITKLHGEELPQEFDLLTYSFPCQDLSIGSVFHNKENGGIEKNSGSRSGLLWEIERILDEREEANLSFPRYLLMENVIQVFSKKYANDFHQWLEKLESLGYYNFYSPNDEKKKWILDATNFGLPQTRKRAFMLSVFVGEDRGLSEKIESILLTSNLTQERTEDLAKKLTKMIYLNKYQEEAQLVHPNYTESRKRIHGKSKNPNKSRGKFKRVGNPILVKYENGKESFTGEIARTITTKQDRDPCAGIIETKWGSENGKPYRYITPRECFGLMGFPNSKFDLLMKNSDYQIPIEKQYRMAGNSICVPILEGIFNLIYRIEDEIFTHEKVEVLR